MTMCALWQQQSFGKRLKKTVFETVVFAHYSQ